MRVTSGGVHGRASGRETTYRFLLTILAAAIAFSLSRCTIGGGTEPSPPDTTPATIAAVSGDGQSGLIGTTLPQPLRVKVSNSEGTGLNDVTVNFSVTSGSATLGTASTNTAGGGNAETTLTLGNVAEAISVRATVDGLSSAADFTAMALVPDSIEVAAGDGQSAPISGALPAPLQVLVRDQIGAPLGGITVDWAITDSAGPGALLSSATSVTDASGVALTALTLGSTEGTYKVAATFVGLTKPAAVFTATATFAPVITSISPTPVREGFAATITGGNFDPVAANNTVTFDGVAATVTSATATSLAIVVPATACMPARDSAQFLVSVGGVAGPPFAHPAIPGDSSISLLAVGNHNIRAGTAVECVQFPAQAGASSFLVVPAIATSSPDLLVSERLSRTAGSSTVFGSGGFNVAPSTLPGRAVSQRRSQVRQMHEARHQAEARLRAYERELLRQHAASARAQFGARAMAQQSGAAARFVVGDTVLVKVANSFTDPCNGFTTVTTVVRSEGTFGIALEDTAAPAGGMTTADYDALIAEFDASIFPTDTAYFGAPSDLDANGVTYLVFSPVVNKIDLGIPGAIILGFFFSGDFFSTASCAQSNGGEYFYSIVADPSGSVGPALSTAFVREIVRGTAAHEFEHLINAAQRIFVTGGPNEETWLDEGLAHLAEEVVGHAVTGLTPGSNLDFATAAANINDFNAYYDANFGRFEDFLVSPQSEAPVQSIADLGTRGAAWNFLRWILDQEATPATEKAITRALVITTLTGVNNLETAVGKSFDSLLAEWLLALFADDFVAGIGTRLTIPSWNLRDIYASLLGAYPLSTTSIGYADGVTDFTGMSGSGRYFVLSSGAPSPAMSLRLTNQSDLPLLSSLLPRLLLLRLP